MKRKNFATILVMLLLVVSAVGVKAQSILLPNGKISNGQPLSAPADNCLFAYSGFSTNNVLVINGVPVPNYNSGWFDNSGYHDNTNTNYICGDYYGSIYRNFFVFDLQNLSSLGITPPITSAVLRVDRYIPEPLQGTQMWQLFNVTSLTSYFSTSFPPGSTTGQNIFNDLGTGNLLGSVVVDKTLSGSPQVVVTLNSAGLAAINSSVGSYFILGGNADSIPPVPVPIWVIAIGFLLIAGLVVLRFRKKRQIA